MFGHLDIVHELCKRGANVNVARTDNNFTALMCASQEGHLKVVRELCANGANVNATQIFGAKVLHIASCHGQLEVVRFILQNGADKSAATTDGRTAFSVATGPHKAALQALLKP